MAGKALTVKPSVKYEPNHPAVASPKPVQPAAPPGVPTGKGKAK